MEREVRNNFLMDNLLSPEYVGTLKRTHRAQKAWGGGGKYWAGETIEFAKKIGAKSVLDYGCGQGALKLHLAESKLVVTEFDPGIPGKDVMPNPADIVVATDVLEHIEPDKVPMTMHHMRFLARKGLFVVIALRPAKLILTDGRNAHLSLFTPAVWEKHIEGAGFKIVRQEQRKGFCVWAN